MLVGKAPDKEAFRAAAEAFLKDAKPQSQNGFKVELAKRCLVHTLDAAAKLA
jgi:xanthine dehydrogenase YagS FAD-binding subunit